MEESLFRFFKTFSDVTRLRMAGLLLNQSLSLTEISMKLDVQSGQVQRNLQFFEKLNILVQNQEQHHIDPHAIEALSAVIIAEHAPVKKKPFNNDHADQSERQIIKNYTDSNGKIRDLPKQAEKRMILLRHMVAVFHPGHPYSEKEVNQLLTQFSDDYASLRRYLIEAQLLKREASGKRYWRPN
jgi:hypothetical protein